MLLFPFYLEGNRRVGKFRNLLCNQTQLRSTKAWLAHDHGSPWLANQLGVVRFSFCLEAGSCYVTQASLKLEIILHQPPRGWDSDVHHHIRTQSNILVETLSFHLKSLCPGIAVPATSSWCFREYFPAGAPSSPDPQTRKGEAENETMIPL